MGVDVSRSSWPASWTETATERCGPRSSGVRCARSTSTPERAEIPKSPSKATSRGGARTEGLMGRLTMGRPSPPTRGRTPDTAGQGGSRFRRRSAGAGSSRCSVTSESGAVNHQLQECTSMMGRASQGMSTSATLAPTFRTRAPTRELGTVAPTCRWPLTRGDGVRRRLGVSGVRRTSRARLSVRSQRG